MSSSTKTLSLAALTVAALSVGIAAAEQPRQRATIAFVEKPWAMAVDITGYKVHMDGMKPDGRRYFFATDATTSMSLSVTLEAVSGQATVQGCRSHMEHITQASAVSIGQGVTQYEIRHLFVIEYLMPDPQGQRSGQLHLFACTGRDNVYADIHISKTGAKPGDEPLLRTMLDRVHVEAAATAGSLDHFRAGSVPYLQGKYAEAIPHYEQALTLEQSNPTLDRLLWRLLIDNLGTAYQVTGKFLQAHSTFEYGLSQDPANPMFHYHLARTYAGMNERGKAMQSLLKAFRNKQHRSAGDVMPDPRQDISFSQFMLDPVFRTWADSLMQPAI